MKRFKSTKMKQLILIAFLLISTIKWANAQQTITIDSWSNIFAAGSDNVSDPGGGGGGMLPFELPIDCGTTSINFTEVSGMVSCIGENYAGPDGKQGFTNIPAYGGISGVYHPYYRMCLVGVFLDDSAPIGDWTGGLNELNPNLEDYAPVLNQVFYIGDGLTGTGAGALQNFYVPYGATRLFIGFADAYNFAGLHGWYNDNSGSLNATVVMNKEEVQLPDCSIYIVETPSSCDAADGYLSLCTVEAGYEVLWSTGSTSLDITDLESGVYTVTITAPSGCSSTCSTVLNSTNSLGDFVWSDENENGTQDAGEEGIEGVEISLYESNAGFISSTISDSEGYYLFEDLPSGSYYVIVLNDPNLEITVSNAGTDEAIDSDIDPETGTSNTVFIYGGICHEDLDIGFKSSCGVLDDAGTIGFDQVLCGMNNIPAMLVELSPATGSSAPLEYVWMYSFNYSSTYGGNWSPYPFSNSPDFQPPTAGGTMYFVRCVRVEGCDQFIESNIVEVFVDPFIHATIYGPNFSCVDETVNISGVDNGPDATYEWYFNDVALNLPPSTLNFTQLVTQSGMNDIKLVVTKGDCVVESVESFYAFSNPDNCNPPAPLDGEDNEDINTNNPLDMVDFSIIPNLVQGEQAKLYFNGFGWSDVNELRILSLDGRIQKYDYSQESEEVLSIQTDDFSAGMYMIYIALENGTQLNKKFIVQH